MEEVLSGINSYLNKNNHLLIISKCSLNVYKNKH
jgi:hypothetical protein